MIKTTHKHVGCCTNIGTLMNKNTYILLQIVAYHSFVGLSSSQSFTHVTCIGMNFIMHQQHHGHIAMSFSASERLYNTALREKKKEFGDFSKINTPEIYIHPLK